MSITRKRQKELRKLQDQANKLWQAQQVVLKEAAGVARDAGRQIGHYNREHVVPAVQHGYENYAAPYVERGSRVVRHVISDKVLPAAGAVVGGALSVWDAAGETRDRLAEGRGFALPDAKKLQKRAERYGKKASKKLAARWDALRPERKGLGAGGVIAIVFGAITAAGILFAALQTFRADDELWVADDPLRAPDA